FYTLILFNCQKFFDQSLPKYDIYDYIIVGSGSAGSTIASGLKGKVLLLEAGSNGDNFLLNIPILQPLLQGSPFDWNFKTSSQENSCLALQENQNSWPIGKIFGGTHQLNNMIYHRGHYDDYKWLIDKKKAEKVYKDYEENIPIDQGKFVSIISTAFVEGGKEMGFEDFSYTNLTHLNGGRFTQINNWNKLENSPETCLNAIVSRVLFDEKNPKKAIGVEFLKKGKLHNVYGRKIILSAGTVGSPKILLHSGIGPEEHLTEVRIKCRENLPVGENLQDHVTTGLDLIILNQTLGLSINDIVNPFKVADFFWFNGDGSPLALAGCDAMGFVKLNRSNEVPDLSFMLLPVGLIADYGLHLRKITNIRDEVWEKYFKPLIGQTTISILPVLLHPKSKGTLRLKSKNFLDSPVINPNYLDNKDDIRKLISGIRIIEKLIETPSMKKFGAEINPKHFPGCENFFLDSNDYWECYIRHMTMTMFHPVGTCKAGNYEDTSTVVLKNFQVKNIENLFVVDGSIIPQSPSANPHGVIAMIAQKFVNDMISTSP
ncbi:CLUMA_CG006030, isoform A, partial [Clunio marinus]